MAYDSTNVRNIGCRLNLIRIIILCIANRPVSNYETPYLSLRLRKKGKGPTSTPGSSRLLGKREDPGNEVEKGMALIVTLGKRNRPFSIY